MSDYANATTEFEKPSEAVAADHEPGFSKADREPGFSVPELESIPLNLEAGPEEERSKSALEHWRDDVLVYDDWPEEQEEELVFRLFHLRGIAGRSLDMAVDVDSLKEMKASLKNAVTALKNAMTTIRALDRHRHGEKQRIMVDHGANVGLPPGKPLRDPRYTLSDQTIDHAFSQMIDGLTHFEASCRSHAEALSKLQPGELQRGLRNGSSQRDRRSWESQYLGLSAYLAGQVVKLRQDLDRRYNRGQQHIVVERSKHRSRARKMPLMPANPADLPQATKSNFAVAQGVKKASREPDDAVSV